MATLTREAVLKVLNNTIDPISGKDIQSAGLVRALMVEENKVRFVLEIDRSQSEVYKTLHKELNDKILAIDGCLGSTIALTAHEEKGPPPDLKPKKSRSQKGPVKIPGVEKIVAIASGKGGVGKSTVSANIACSLALAGHRVGLLDADVYGPSQPRMLGVSGRPSSPDGKTIVPMLNHGVTMMSLGLMTNEDQAMIWRGPMLMGALQQMLMQVQWGALDILLVDLPPGTGDVQLSLCQKAEVNGAVIVSTPQDVALLDARKGINMFFKLKVPILGLIENMSTHICPNCGHQEHIFDNGGVVEEAKKLNVPILAEIPLLREIRSSADGGTPVVVSKPDIPASRVFQEAAHQLMLYLKN